MLWTDLSDADKDAAGEHFASINAEIPAGSECVYGPTYRAFDLDDNESTRRQLRKRRDVTAVPKSTTPDYTEMVLELHGDAVVIGDVEIPDHDADMLERAMQIGKLFGIRQLIINGDFMASDGLSAHPPPPKDIAPTPSFDSDKRVAKSIIRALARQFFDITLLEGNHERRLSRFTFGNETVSHMINEFAEDAGIGIRASYFAHVDLISGGKEWLVCHQKNYSRQPGSVARDIAEIQRKNVICAHTHHLSESQTKCGQLMAIDGGYCRDEKRTMYKVADITRHPKWNPGFVVIRNGYHYLFSRDKTDWDFWFGLNMAANSL